jgi:hypothetical protein
MTDGECPLLPVEYLNTGNNAHLEGTDSQTHETSSQDRWGFSSAPTRNDETMGSMTTEEEGKTLDIFD